MTLFAPRPTPFSNTRGRPPVDGETLADVSAKVGTASSVTAVAAPTASAVASVKSQDGVQLSADVMRIAGTSLGSTSVTTGGQAITSLNKAAKGDLYGAAAAANAGLTAVSPELATSPVGAGISLVMVLAGQKQLGDQVCQIKERAATAVDPEAPADERAKAALDVGAGTYQVAAMAQAVGGAAVRVGGAATRLMGQSAALAPVASQAGALGGAVTASRLGQMVGVVNKWIPLLNIVGVALSAKNAIEVFGSETSSTTSKVLSGLSLVAAGAAFAAGIWLGALPLAGLVVGSVVLDVALGQARRYDQQGGDTDAVIARWTAHPEEGAGAIATWTGDTLKSIGTALTSLTRS